MAKFSDGEREILTRMGKLTRDSNGNEVLVGLTLEETYFYLNYKESQKSNANPPGTEMYLELHQKHVLAAQHVIFAEAEMRAENPSRH